MTAETQPADRGRSLRDDLLHDLQQGPSRPLTPAAPTPSPSPAPRPSSTAPPETPSVELRITPRSWSPVGWSLLPSGAGFVVSAGPVRLSLGRARR